MVSSIAKPLLIVVVSWLFVIFVSFRLLLARNATALLALTSSRFRLPLPSFSSWTGPAFGGLIQISSQPMLNALSQLAK